MPKKQSNTIAAGPPPDETLMTTTELMAFLNLSRTKIWTMIQRDGLPAFKFGGDYRFRKSEVLKWMELYRTNTQNGTGDTGTRKR